MIFPGWSIPWLGVGMKVKSPLYTKDTDLNLLEKPDISDSSIVIRLQQEYGLMPVSISFLPIGVDVNNAVYHIETDQGFEYFLKLRRGLNPDTAVMVPTILKEQGTPFILAPLETASGQLWSRLEDYRMILFPFVWGEDGYHRQLPDDQWENLGICLKSIHSTRLPQQMKRQLERESFSSCWRDEVTAFQHMVSQASFDDPAAIKMAALMRDKQALIGYLVERAGQLSTLLRARSPVLVLCHGDLHPGNLLIPPEGHFYLVDWDNLILSLKEKDLVFIDGDMGGQWCDPARQQLFYRGYGNSLIDWEALAYFRLERIIQDIAAYGEQLLLSSTGGEDREQGYQYFASNFLPHNTIEIALNTDRRTKFPPPPA